MSRILSASDIGGLALRTIGEWPVTESAPDGEKLRTAMEFLDLLMGETTGTERLFSQVTPSTLPLAIVNGTQSYNLYQALGSSLPPDKLQFIVGAWLQDGNGNRYDVEIVPREKFEAIPKPAETG